ncbi:MAG: hypothetical protein KDB27_16800 [Planctomycetales bacterium]|nr:hypothetical protein [Planctomycetales bacterium]
MNIIVGWQRSTMRNGYAHLSRIPSPIAEASLSDANSWFCGTLDADHPLSGWEADYSSVDPWGNPYVCVQREEHTDCYLLPRHVYSKGRDGISSSDGNDADDLSSWSDDSMRYYVNELNAEARLQLFLKSVLILPFVFPCCVYELPEN